MQSAFQQAQQQFQNFTKNIKIPSSPFGGIKQKLDQILPPLVKQAETAYKQNVLPTVRHIANQPLIQLPGIGATPKVPSPTLRQTANAVLPNFEQSIGATAMKGNFTQVPQAFNKTNAILSDMMKLDNPDKVNTFLMGSLNPSFGKIDFKPVVKKFAPKLTSEDVNLVGRIAELIETGKGKTNLGQQGKDYQLLAEHVFGKQAANWSTSKIKGAFDIVLEKIGKQNNSAGLGLSMQTVDRGLRSTPKGSFTNVKEIDNPLLRGKNWQKTLQSPADEGKQFVSEMENETIKVLKNNQFNNPLFAKEINKIQHAVDSPGQTPLSKKINLFDYLATPEYMMQKIGLGKEAAILRKHHEAYQKELPLELTKVTEWMKRVPEKGSSQRIFQHLDGQGVKLNPEETKVAGEIKTYLSEWADKLKLPQDKRIKNYITRLFDKDFIQKEFDEDLAKIITNKVPGEVYDPFLQKRLGKYGYKEDVWGALDAYIKRASRKVNYDPALKLIEGKSQNLELSQLNYVKRYLSGVNMRPVEVENLIDNFIKTTPIGYKATQRPVTFLSQKVRNLAYKGALGLNPASAIRNLGQGANTYSQLGEKYTPLGYIKVLTKGTQELVDQGVLDDGFIQDRNLSVYKSFLGKADEGLMTFFNLAEKINRGAAYYGAKAKGLDKGMDESQAIEYAKEIVRKTQFSFGRIDSPVALQSDLAKTIGQFASYPIKQTEFLINMFKNKEYAGLIRYAAATAVYATALQKTLGLKYDILPQFSASPLVQTAGNLYNVATGDEDERQQALRDLPKSLTTYIPGGVQARKTIEALEAMNEGGSFTPSGELRFEVKPELKPLIFGIWSSQEAQDYLNKRQGNNLSPEEQEASNFQKQEKDVETVQNKLAFKMHNTLKQANPEERKQIVRAWAEQGLITKELLSELKNLKQRDKAEKYTPFAKAVVKSSQSNIGRAKFINLYLSKRQSEKSKLLRELQEAGILTTDLFEKMIEQKKLNK